MLEAVICQSSPKFFTQIVPPVSPCGSPCGGTSLGKAEGLRVIPCRPSPEQGQRAQWVGLGRLSLAPDPERLKSGLRCWSQGSPQDYEKMGQVMKPSACQVRNRSTVKNIIHSFFPVLLGLHGEDRLGGAHLGTIVLLSSYRLAQTTQEAGLTKVLGGDWPGRKAESMSHHI